MTAKPELLTQEQIDAMDETAGHIRAGHDIELPVRHGGDMRLIAAMPVHIADALAKGKDSLNIEGWDD